jgi:lipoprotein-anchoring transpeptidase ErfK/SrfK
MQLRNARGSGATARRCVAFTLSSAFAFAFAFALAPSMVVGTAHAHAASPSERPAEIAVLAWPHRLVSARGIPRANVATVTARRPITGVRTVLPVIGETETPDGVRLLHVRLPGRPNGSTGWIKRAGTTLASTRWRIVVRTTRPRVLVYRDGRLAHTFVAIVGKASTPTPHGRFFVEESVRMPPRTPGGTYALALSAHSDVLQAFEGGSAQIAMHGVERLDGNLGTASSHGCIRLDDRGIRWMAAHIAPGVAVTIRS